MPDIADMWEMESPSDNDEIISESWALDASEIDAGVLGEVKSAAAEHNYYRAADTAGDQECDSWNKKLEGAVPGAKIDVSWELDDSFSGSDLPGFMPSPAVTDHRHSSHSTPEAMVFPTSLAMQHDHIAREPTTVSYPIPCRNRSHTEFRLMCSHSTPHSLRCACVPI